MSLDMRYPTPLPDTKGWGPGWPRCQSDKITPHPVFQGGLRDEVIELVDVLVTEAERRGYVFHKGWSWGYGCRATKGGSGEVPSFHSWGLALDINAPENPFTDPGSPLDSDIATHNRWLVPLLGKYGFYWLGPSIGDWMHFSFTGSPADARALTEAAVDDLTTAEDEVANLDKYQQGWDAYADKLRDRPDVDPGPPPSEWSVWKKRGWNAARFAANNPRTGG